MRILKTKNISSFGAGIGFALLAFFAPTVASATSSTSVLYYGEEDGALLINNSDSFDSDEYYTFVANSIVSPEGVGMGAAVLIEIDDNDSISDLDASFISNYTNANNSAGGALIIISGTLNTLNASFSGNYVETASGIAQGGAIYNSEGEIGKIVGDFTSNYAKATEFGGIALGGAIANYSSVFALEGNFSGNYASGSVALGGAVYASLDSITKFSASGTDEYFYVGNYAESNGEKLDSNGGFLYLDGDASAVFSTDDSSIITIGYVGIDGFDSIASRDSSASIKKKGEGTLLVNSSMEYYTGSLSVAGGTMIVNNVLSASSILIKNDASLIVDTLNVYLDSNASLYSSVVSIESGFFSLASLDIYLTSDFMDELTGVGISIIDDTSSISSVALSVYYASGDSCEPDFVDSSLYTFTNGVFTYLGSTAVPEPTTYAMILGIISLGFAYRRRKN